MEKVKQALYAQNSHSTFLPTRELTNKQQAQQRQ